MTLEILDELRKIAADTKDIRRTVTERSQDVCGNCLAPAPVHPSPLSPSQQDEVRAIVASMLASVLNGANDRLADAVNAAAAAHRSEVA